MYVAVFPFLTSFTEKGHGHTVQTLLGRKIQKSNRIQPSEFASDIKSHDSTSKLENKNTKNTNMMIT